jgi:AraC-like DNA-binding protein/ligand-binding sensor protein
MSLGYNVQKNNNHALSRAKGATMPTTRNDLPGMAPRTFVRQGPATDAMLSNRTEFSNQELAESLADSPLFREFQEAFEAATALPLTLRGVESWRLAHADRRNQNGFCALMFQANGSCAGCLRVQQQVCDGVNGTPCTLTCSFGLRETAVGVKIGNEIVVYLQTGQVFFKTPTTEQTRRALEQIDKWGLKLDKDEITRRYEATPVVREVEYQARIKLLQFFANQLGTLADQIVFLQKTAEPPQMTWARKIIEEQYEENLSLTVVAKQLRMSKFTLCNKFKKATGVTFTEYISRFRVQKAKNLLLNRNYSVSEIAYQVGFQSLTHFNRCFKKIVGEPPSGYRSHLPAPATAPASVAHPAKKKFM